MPVSFGGIAVSTYADAVQYAVALMRNALAVASDYHRPFIVGHIAALEESHEMVAAADALVSTGVKGPEGGVEALRQLADRWRVHATELLERWKLYSPAAALVTCADDLEALLSTLARSPQSTTEEKVQLPPFPPNREIRDGDVPRRSRQTRRADD
jgi:hypothetical protein